MLQVIESDVRLDSRCPVCSAVFRPEDHLPGTTERTKPRPLSADPMSSAAKEPVHDFFLPPRRPTTAALTRVRGIWFLLVLLLLSFCGVPLLRVFAFLLDVVFRAARGEPGPIVGVGILLAFATGLLSLWMCSNSDRPPPYDDIP